MSTDQILAVSIEARINRLERDMRKASGVVGKNFDQIDRRSKRAADRMESHWSGMAGKFASIGKGLAVGLIGGLTAGGINALIGRVGDVAKGIAEIGDEAKRAGLNVEDFQELKYVAEQNRLGVDSLVDGIKELNLRADEFITTGGGSAAEAFARLGYDAETLAIKLRNPSALFSEIIGKLGHLDRAAQIRIADEIFGGTGGERFVQLIEQGEDAINRTRQEAHDLGLVMDQDLIDKADALDRKFNQVANTVGTALKTAIVEAAAALGDFINAFNGFVSHWMDDHGPGAGLGGNQPWSELLTPEQRDKMRLQLHFGADNGDPYEGFQFGADGNIVIAPPFVPPAITVTNPNTGSGGGGRSAGPMREQRDAAAELIAELQNELLMLGQSELEQRINAELRRAGANATDEQKTSIRELVTAIETERTALQQLETALDNAKGLAKDFLGGLLSDLRSGVDGATALANAFGRLADRLLDMALDALVNNLFSNLMGGLGGGLFGGLLGFNQGGVVEAATGGYIRGPGTGTSDSIPARLSNGEFVVRASETAKHRDLLEAINAGQVPAFATGGIVGSEPRFRPANDNRGSANDNEPTINISAPITVEGSAGTPEQNEDLARRMTRELEATMRGVVVDEMRKAMRPGNMANNRAF